MKLNRRRFLLGTALAGGALLVGYAASRPSRQSLANENHAAQGQTFLTTWLRIDPLSRHR